MQPRPIIPAVLLVLAMVVVPLAGVALANAVRPVIASEPSASPESNFSLQPMPEPPGTIRPLATWFEPLPVVAPGTTTAPRPFVTRYNAARIGDLRAAAALIDVAFGELRVDKSARPATKRFLDALVVTAPESTEPDPDNLDDQSDVPVGTFDTPEFNAVAEPAMRAIAAAPANAQGLNDLAVAIATTSIAEPSIVPTDRDAGRPLAGAPQLREAATRLLELGLAAFPADRSMSINLAYLRSLDNYIDDSGEMVLSDQLPAAIEALQTYANGAPPDATARWLLADLVVRTDLAYGLDRALAIAQPVIDDPGTEAAGRVISGDARFLAADRDRVKSPFAARSELADAKGDYDRAIELTGDAAAYAGRARALDLLGARDRAVEAQREAVRLEPTSIPWRLRLARLNGCAGQTTDWRRDAQDAFGMAGKGSKPSVSATRYVVADLVGQATGAYSIGSDLPSWDTTIRVPATGGVTVAVDPFPEPEACLSTDPTMSTAIDDTALEAVLAALADDDRTGARAALDAWRVQLPVVEGEPFSDSETMPAVSTVLDLLAGKPLPEDDDGSISTFLPLASRLPATAQSAICTALSKVVGLAQGDVDALTVCAAEAADRSSGHEAAAIAIEPAVHLGDPTNPPAGPTVLKAGMLSELTGHLDVARTRYEAAASYAETSIAGLLRLGDLDLREGDASGAIDHYALARAAIQTQSAAADGIEMTEPLVARLGQYLDNNRGIALLMSARTANDAPPDCTRFAAACAEARDAFTAAMAADPKNPIYPMNAAWVARLTGDGDRATALLTQALEEGTPLVAPAWNDLGVLAAQRGDLGAAQADFVQAIATQPEYDLATWNLGVVESRQAGLRLLDGQALLADATRLNRDLLTSQLAYKGDERVYRIEVSGTKLELARAPGTGAAIGAAAFGAIATLGALGQLISGMGGDVQEAAEIVAGEGAGRVGRRVRGLSGRFGAGVRRWPSWAAWIPAIVILTVTTAWTAAWMAPDAIVTAVLIGLAAAALALVVHTCGHLVIARRLNASIQASGWTPGIALAIVGMPFHVPAGPFLAEQITTGDPRRDWWASFAGVVANLVAAGIALLIYVSAPMPFLRVLIATQLAVAAFSLIPSHPLDGDRLATQPIALAFISLGVAAASTAIAFGTI